MKSLVRKVTILILAILLTISLVPLCSQQTYADNDKGAVKVGFFEYPGYHEMKDGTKSGYGYDFLMLLQEYTGMEYDYVGYDKSWADMQQMLQDGEIDFVTSARKTPEREEIFDFSEPIGTNSALINVRDDDSRFDAGEYDELDGVVIGELKGNSRNEDVKKFAKEKGFKYEVKEFDTAEELAEALQNKQVDAIATSSLRKSSGEKTVAEFSPEYFYAIVKKGNTKLLKEINDGISQMDLKEGSWRDDLFYKNFKEYTVAQYLKLHPMLMVMGAALMVLLILIIAAFIVWRRTSKMKTAQLELELVKQKQRLGAIPLSSDILTKANVGLWSFELDEGQPPRMYVDDTMLQLIGLDHQVSPEETYHAWYDHIDEGSYDLVTDAVEKMTAGEHAEVQYPWHHPSGATWIVRCGGVRNPEYKQGIRIEGTHQNVTEVLHFDEEQQKQKEKEIIEPFIANYNLVYKVDMSDASFSRLKTEKDVFGEEIDFADFRETRHYFVDEFAYESDRKMLRHQMDFDTIRERLKTESTYSVEFRANINGIAAWHEMIVSALHDDEVAIGFVVRDIEVLNRHISQSLLDNYDAIYVANLNTDKMKVLKASGIMQDKPEIVTYSKMLHEFASGLDTDAKEYFEKVSDLEYEKELLKQDGKTEYTYQTPYYGEDQVWLKCETHVLTWDDDEPETMMIGISKVDTLQREKIELNEKLADALDSVTEEKNRFAVAADLINAANWSFTLDENDEIIDAEFFGEPVKILGIDLDITPHAWEGILHPDDKEETLKAFNNAIKDHSGNTPYDVIYRMEDKDGNYNWFRSAGKIIIQKDGKREFFGVHLNINDRIEKDQEQNTITSYFLEPYTSAYYIGLDDLSCNVYRRAEELNENYPIKTSFLDTLNNYIDHEVVPEDRDELRELIRPENMRRRLAKELEYSHTFRTLSEGVEKTYLLNVIRGADENHAGFGFRDITEELEEQQSYQKTLEKALSEAQSASKAKTEFLFNMSHDVRTPMNAILGFTNMAEKYIDDKEKVMDCLEKTQQSGTLLLKLINSVLDMSRIESGSAESQEQAGDVLRCFAGIESTMRETAETKDIDLTFEFGEIEDRFVYADFSRCIRIFTNLISNAIKYTPEGGRVNVRCEQVSPKKDGAACYRYTIEDNGYGMSKEFQQHMFEAFTREHNSTVSGIQGTGLGLSVCKTFVDYLGGTIECSSRQGEGTRFTVTLPFKIQEGEFAGNSTDYADVQNMDFTGRKVLLVEDNELNREIAMDILEEEGLVIDEAENGSAAVKKVEEKGSDYYDFILMDIQMPVMNGYEATKIIREKYPDADIPIIAVSANAFEEDRQASKEAGMDDHVAKPIDIKELFSVLSKHL